MNFPKNVIFILESQRRLSGFFDNYFAPFVWVMRVNPAFFVLSLVLPNKKCSLNDYTLFFLINTYSANGFLCLCFLYNHFLKIDRLTPVMSLKPFQSLL